MNPEHLAVVKQGAEAIAKWGLKNNTTDLDLSGADLNRAELAGANLSMANLSGANLREANLSGASLTLANLNQANLTRANLTEAQLGSADLTRATLRGAKLTFADLDAAKLREADLSGADLREANLSRAKLREADLSGADLCDAYLNQTDLIDSDLTRAICSWTTFASVDLSSVKGLETIHHDGPSTLGVDTLYQSKGKIPDIFLRECGVPEDLIAYIYSRFGPQQPILSHLGQEEAVQFYSCFISYSHKDEEFAKRLHGRLRDAGLRVWYAPEEMKGGRKLHEQIDEGIRIYDKLLLVLSKESLASEWVNTEIRKARKAERKEGRQKLFPIRLVPFDPHIKEWECFDADSGKDLGAELREYFIPDFERWKDHDAFEAGMARLLKELRAGETREAA